MLKPFTILIADDNSTGGGSGYQDDIQQELEKIKTELDDTKQKLIEAETWKKKYEEIENDTRTELLKKLNTSQKEFAKDLPLEKLRSFVKIAVTGKPVDTDKGGTPSQKGDNRLSEDEKKEAERMGLPEEIYLIFKKQRQQRKEAKKNGKY
ncbi:MAG: hypothetical protein EHM58_03150 [Ignavibacteriae bacterium]|nr:MAG: hypothetical protein EHM58_03150 [Ignavibacteriota bacterium]